VETGHGMWRLGQFLKTVGATSGVAPSPVVVLTAVVTAGGPSPSNSSTREALIWQVDGASSGGYGG
jgi:hypothetical protein